jgi:hypothetical protein
MRFAPPIVLALATLGAGCAAKVQARVPETPMPTLDAPPAPPRIIAVYDDFVEPPREAATVDDPPSPVRPPARPTRPELPVEPPADPAAPPRAATPAPPPLMLTPAPGTEAQTEASIRTLLERAQRDLARINPSTLDHDGRTQFDTARRFLQQSQDALKAKNLVFAGKLADKAAAMAAVLVR